MKDKILKWNDVLNFANNGNPAPDRRVEKKDEEWRQQLTEEEFYITRKKGTEARFSGEHCSRYEPGKYGCVCCDNELFDSGEKFDSGTGWPSFTLPKGVIATFPIVIFVPKDLFKLSVAYFPKAVCTNGNDKSMPNKRNSNKIAIRERNSIFLNFLIRSFVLNLLPII